MFMSMQEAQEHLSKKLNTSNQNINSNKNNASSAFSLFKHLTQQPQIKPVISNSGNKNRVNGMEHHDMIDDNNDYDDERYKYSSIANILKDNYFVSPISHSQIQYDCSAPIARNTPENNQVKLIEYRCQQIASFTVDGKELLCLPQAFEIFLKNLVGGLHTVYTKLKRLDIVPIVCNVEQVRVLRGLGAIQPGVNRCKLIAPAEFDVLYEDCTNSGSRPGRPPKRHVQPSDSDSSDQKNRNADPVETDDDYGDEEVDLEYDENDYDQADTNNHLENKNSKNLKQNGRLYSSPNANKTNNTSKLNTSNISTKSMTNDAQKNYLNPFGLNENLQNQSNHQLNSSSSSSPFSILTNLSTVSSNGSQTNHFNMTSAAAAAALTNFHHDLQNQHLLKSLNLNENLLHQPTSLNNQQQSAALMNFLPNYQSLLTTQNKFNGFNQLSKQQQAQTPFFTNHTNMTQTNSSPAFTAAALAFYGSIFNNPNSFMMNQNNEQMNESTNNKQDEHKNQHNKQNLTSQNEQLKQLEALNLMNNNNDINKNNQNMQKSLNHSLNLVNSAKSEKITKLYGSLPTSSPSSRLSNSSSSSFCSVQSDKNIPEQKLTSNKEKTEFIQKLISKPNSFSEKKFSHKKLKRLLKRKYKNFEFLKGDSSLIKNKNESTNNINSGNKNEYISSKTNKLDQKKDENNNAARNPLSVECLIGINNERGINGNDEENTEKKFSRNNANLQSIVNVFHLIDIIKTNIISIEKKFQNDNENLRQDLLLERANRAKVDAKVDNLIRFQNMLKYKLKIQKSINLKKKSKRINKLSLKVKKVNSSRCDENTENKLENIKELEVVSN